jgi:hypothetical protein
MQGFDKKKFEIELLSREYMKSKRVLTEAQKGTFEYDKRTLERSICIVGHIDMTYECLNEADKLIIRNELMEGRRGDWFKSYLSPSAYYRHRKRAYENFLHCL